MFYLISFLLAMSFALPLYVSSTFLAGWIGVERVGLVYALGALVGLFFIALFPALVRRIGVRKSFTLFAAVSLAALALLPSLDTSVFVFAAFTLYLVALRLLPLHLDIFLETLSRNATTGRIRGLYATALNLGIITYAFSGFILLFGLISIWTGITFYALSRKQN